MIGLGGFSKVFLGFYFKEIIYLIKNLKNNKSI